MEGVPTGDIQAKYQKLASEYSKLRTHVKVLKKGVLDEQAKCTELKEMLKEKDKSLRKGELEIDSLSFRNQQLTRRVSVLQDELDLLQVKLTKKVKGKVPEKDLPSTSQRPLDSGVLQEELQKKIIENAQIASVLADRSFEVSQLRSTLEDYQKTLLDNETKYKTEIARLKNKNHELQFSLEEAQRTTPNKCIAISSQTTSCNGDFMSEVGSLVGSEDALSSVDDQHFNEQMVNKIQSLEKDNEKMKMETELLRMENENLKLDLSKYVALSQKRRSDNHDSGDFNNFNETSFDGVGRVTGLLGSSEVPFVLSDEVASREMRVKKYYRDQISDLNVERDRLSQHRDHLIVECDMLKERFDEMVRDRESDDITIQEKHKTIQRLEEELHSTSTNYEEQMSVLTEHVAVLNDKLAKQHEHIEQMGYKMNKKK